MKINTFVISSALLVSCVNTTYADQPVESEVQQQSNQAFYDQKKRGWFFYEEKPKVVKKKEVKQKPPEVLTPVQMLKKQGEEFDNALATAILNPSPQNYKKYMEMSTQILTQSAMFADGLEKFTYVNPKYDYTIQNPQGSNVQIHNIMNNQAKDNLLATSAKDNALLFFFRSDCPYCHKYAPIIKEFAANYGYIVETVSLDGRGLPEYPNPRYNPRLAQQLKVETVPAIYLLNPKQNKVTAVGFGLSDYGTLGNKIIAALTRKNGEQ